MISKNSKNQFSRIKNFGDQNLIFIKGVGEKTATKFFNKGFDKVHF